MTCKSTPGGKIRVTQTIYHYDKSFLYDNNAESSTHTCKDLPNGGHW